MTPKPPTWTDLHPDTRTDAITWHRDPRDVSGEQKLDLIAAISPAAYDRAHAALDAILGPLLVPYEIGGPAGRAAQEQADAERQKIAEAIVLLGEAVNRFALATVALRCSDCGHPISSGGLYVNGICKACLLRAFHTSTPLGWLVGEDVVEMTEAEFKSACMERYQLKTFPADWLEPARLGCFRFGSLGSRRKDLDDRRVRIVERQEAGRGEERESEIEWLTQSEWAWRRKEIGAGLIYYASPPEYDAFGDTLRPGHSIRVVPDGTKWGVWYRGGNFTAGWCENGRSFVDRVQAEAYRANCAGLSAEPSLYSVRPLLSSSDKGRRG